MVSLFPQLLAEHPDPDASRDRDQEHHAGEEGTDPSLAIACLREGQFLDYILEQLRSGRWTPTVRLSDADLAAIEAEPIGEHFSQYPFLY